MSPAPNKAPRRRRKTQMTRLQRHRAEMRRRGFKLVQLWVPDPTASRFRDAVRRTRKFLEEHPDAAWDELALRMLDDAPEWKDS
jgi:DNA-binding LacI/PurR family transcriptional regulator